MQVARSNYQLCGWKVVDNILAIEWDSAENQAAINERVLLLTKGCKLEKLAAKWVDVGVKRKKRAAQRVVHAYTTTISLMWVNINYVSTIVTTTLTFSCICNNSGLHV